MAHHLSRDLCKPKAGLPFRVDDVAYELGGKIGDGAAGLVRRAVLVDGNRPRAVKFLAPDPKYIEESAFDDVAARFRREGERGAALDHPHLVKSYAYRENAEGEGFSEEGVQNPCLLMELVKGKTLKSYIKNLPEDDRGKFIVTQEKLHLAIQVADALQYLRNRSLIHRDIKPANIFLEKEPRSKPAPRAKIGDFGIVKWGDFNASIGTGTLTVTSQEGLGTLKYMSPEQALSPRDVSVRSDIYSLGITYFELFTSAITPSAHHVYQIMNARMARGNTLSRYNSIGIKLRGEDEGIAELVIDMHLRGSTGRPAINNVQGRLEWEYETRYGADWRRDS